MAKKRMFSKQITDSDAFLDMPLSSQCLYFHLNMHADDDGFIDSPKRIMRMCGAKEDDVKVLIAKRFLLTFDDGLLVIKHWRIHNTLRKDRYIETAYTDQKNMLEIKENKAYTEKWQPNGNHLVTQISIDKNRLDKISIDKTSSKEEEPTVFGNEEINEVISRIKESCSKHGVVYSGTGKYERQRAKNLLQGPFTKSIEPFGMDLRTFIDNLIMVSTRLKYNSKPVSSAKDIFYNRADVINKAKQQQVTPKTQETVVDLTPYLN